MIMLYKQTPRHHTTLFTAHMLCASEIIHGIIFNAKCSTGNILLRRDHSMNNAKEGTYSSTYASELSHYSPHCFSCLPIQNKRLSSHREYSENHDGKGMHGITR